MANKTANVLARVEPDIKEQAEFVMTQLGIPVSVVINMLYKQIVLTKSIPFSLSLPTKPKALDEIDQSTFDSIMQKGTDDAKAGRTRSVSEVFDDIKHRL